MDEVVQSIFEMLKILYTQGIYLEEEEESFLLGIPFYSTFFTSVWVWLYALSGGTLRLVSSTRRFIKLLKWFLDIESHPLRSMGAVAGGISAGNYGLMIVFSAPVNV